MFPSFQRRRSNGGGRSAGNSNLSVPKSKKFDLTKWFKLSTDCGMSNRSVLCDDGDTATPFMTMINSTSSSETSPETGKDNCSLFNRYSLRLRSTPTKKIQNPEQRLNSLIKEQHSNSIAIVHSSQSANLPETAPTCRSFETPPSSSQHPEDPPDQSNSMLHRRNCNDAISRKDSYDVKNDFFPESSFSKRTSDNSKRPFLKPRKLKPVWKCVRDPKSKKKYYYEVHSRVTQWHKPLELASESERRAIQKKESAQKDFFSSMEDNIIKCMQKGIIPGSPSGEGREEDKVHPLKDHSLVRKDLARPALIKTISSMDVDLLAELTRVEGEDNKNECPTTPIIDYDLDSLSKDCGVSFKDTISPTTDFSNEFQQRRHSLRDNIDNHEQITRICHETKDLYRNSNNSSHQVALGCVNVSSSAVENLNSSSNNGKQPIQKPSFDRRNTCGTIYVKSTMAAPDIYSTIKCVCAVYRAHLLQSVRDKHTSIHTKVTFSEYEIFNDSPLEHGNNPTISQLSYHTSRIKIEEMGSEIEMSADTQCHAVPSLDEITDFYRYVFDKAQMESDCIIVSLIYAERLLRDTNGGVWPNPKNWRSLLFSCMVMASKVWDDLSMWNKDFSHVCPLGVKFSLKRINELELALLNCLKFNVKVLASEYAKYYFLMRSMLIRSGLAGEELITLKPLDNEGAKRLEFMTTNYKALPKPKKTAQRSKTVGEIPVQVNFDVERRGDANKLTWQPASQQVNHEQVVNM